MYNRYVTGQHFIGRKEDCAILGNLLTQSENVVVWEPFGAGKKSLVHQVFTKMKVNGDRFTVGEMTALDIREGESFVKRLGAAVIRLVASTPDEYEKIVTAYMEGTHWVFDRKAFSDRDIILSTNWDLDDKDLKSVLRLPYVLAAERGEKTFMIIDEFQNLDLADDGERIFKLMEEVMDEAKAEGLRIFSYIFIGSQVNAMEDIFIKRHFFYRRATRLKLSRVDEREIVEHIIKGFLASGKVIDRDLISGACRLFKCNLFYINHFTSVCDSLSKGYIMEPVLLEALATVMAINRGRFISMMNDLTTFQVSLLKAIIDGYSKFSTAEVIRKYSLNSSANVRRLKDALMKKEILTFVGEDAKPVILDPLFEYWLRNYYSKRINNLRICGRAARNLSKEDEYMNSAKKKIAVLTGAGVSAESGLSTFRGNNGLWGEYDPEEVASIQGWYRNRELVLNFYNGLRKRLSEVKPNAAHYAIADLEKEYSVTVITQNVDNLHERAGSTKVLHLHGEATKVRPEDGEYDRSYSEKEVIDIGYDEVHLGDKAPNGSQLRPHIVFFGEAVPNIEKAIDIVSAADIMLIVGTSLNVYPAAGLYRYAPNGIPIYLIDPEDVAIADPRIIQIHQVATKGMETFRRMLGQ